jgi:tetratricopeptide (TPR) repeat protein
MRIFVVTLFSWMFTAAAAAQSVEGELAAGDSLTEALNPAEALEHYRKAFQLDQSNYEILWKFARAQIDVAKQLEGKEYRDQRDSLFWVASLYADSASKTDPADPAGHFMRAQALGRLSRERGGQERVRYGRQIYDAAARVLELDPDHDGAHHVLGAWHAEVMRLSGIARFFAKAFLGGGYLSRASWDSAVVHLELAVSGAPDYIYHRLELAEIYIDFERYADARFQLDRITELPPTSDVRDRHYKQEAVRLLEDVQGKL